MSPTEKVATALAKYAGASKNDVSISTVGPTWGHTVSRKAEQALLYFFILLAVYLSVRFESKMAAAAIIAVIHDIIFTVGVYALFHFQVTPATITAFLTILGFSLYDTVVVFDKVRENQRVLTATGRSTYGEMVNKSLNQVLMRSLSTSFVALMPVLSLLIVGAGDLRRDVARRLRPRARGRVCSSVRTRRSSSPRRCWRGGRNASRSTARWPNGAPRRRPDRSRRHGPSAPATSGRPMPSSQVDAMGGSLPVGTSADAAREDRRRRWRCPARPRSGARFSPAPASNAAASASSVLRLRARSPSAR